MRQTSNPDPITRHLVLAHEKPLSPSDDAYLCDALKRCSPATRAAAREFRRTGSPDHVPLVIHGLIEHYAERDAQARLNGADDSLLLVEDLGIDSLTLLEIVSLAEDVLQVSIENEEIRPFRTVGDIKKFIRSKLQGAAG
jgi:3-hydroxyacyl-[acyl-carrier-protein] dehydratase